MGFWARLFKRKAKPKPDIWDCICHERLWKPPYYDYNFGMPGWISRCTMCNQRRRLADTRIEAFALYNARPWAGSAAVGGSLEFDRIKK